MLDQLKSSDFSPHLNQSFRLDYGGEEPLLLELISVTLFSGFMEPVDAKGRRNPFSLLFRGPKGAYLPQRIYRLEHAEMDAIEIFIVPLAPDQEGSRFEAIFT